MTALEPVRFPRFKAGNVLRGALGTILSQTAPDEYHRIFAPHATGGPSGLQDPPRPFIFRCGHLNGTRVPAGGAFWFDLHLFGTAGEPAVLQRFVDVFSRLEQEGLGVSRGRAHLRAVEPLAAPLVLELSAPEYPVRQLRVEFVTPTEWKGGAATSFETLFKRSRDRVSTLREMYGEGALVLDFAAMGARAAEVQTVSSDLKVVDVERKSTRTGEVHPLGGFIGSAEYAGDLGEFLPVLRAAEWTGVGRHTVWGQGQIRVTAPTLPDLD